MIPRTYPSTLNPVTGQRQLVALFLSDVTGLQRWSDYIPVNFGKGTTLIEGSYDNNGYIAVEEITSGIGMTPFNEYVPVFFDPAATDTWQVSDVGFIPYGASGVTSAPSLDLVFTRSDSLDPRVTFTRASTATYTSSAGLLTTAAINSPRLDYDPVTLAPKGLLIEESRTNFITYSNTNTNFENSSISGTVTFIDGAPANVYQAALNTTAHRATITSIAGPVATTVTTQSAFVYIPPGSDVVRLFFRVRSSSSSGAGGVFLVESNVVTVLGVLNSFGPNPPPNITADVMFANAVGNGWYRIGFTSASSSSSADTTVRIDIGFSNVVAETSLGTVNTYVAITGWQLETGAFPTSYIPTEASQVTRAADLASMTGTNFSSWYVQTGGTVVTAWDIYAFNTGASVRFSINDGTTSNMLRARIAPSGTIAVRHDVTNAGVTSVLGSPTVVNIAATKEAFAFATNDYAGCINAETIITNATLVLPVATTLYIGTSGGTAFWLNGHIRRISYFPRRLANAELQALTA